MKYEPNKGVNIYQATEEAISLACKEWKEIELVFNGISVYVSPHSYANDIVTIYALKREVDRLKDSY